MGSRGQEGGGANPPGLVVRPAVQADLPAIVAIYNHYIAHAQTPFTTEPATVAGRAAWFAGFDQARYHLLVAELPAGLMGWASSSPYRPTPAFDHTVETSVYLHPEAHGRGVGSRLYAALLELLRGQAVHTVLAGVALPNPGSVALHRKFGFEEVGTFKEYARKRGAWISSTWFQKMLP
jgi:phosphinothricin acetyltransferase